MAAVLRQVRTWLAVLVVTPCCLAAAGQVQLEQPGGLYAPNRPNPQVKRDTITGTVYNSATNEPVRRALVNVSSGGEQLVAFTGADGRFEIEGVPDGQAFITAQRPGFMPEQANGQPFSGSKPFLVGPGNNDFRIPLQPAARITGMVVDADGEPIAGIQIQILAEQIAQGRKQLNNQGGVMTDENGMYQKGDLPPGNVYIESVETRTGVLPTGEIFKAQYYSGSDNISSAQPVELRAGEEARADFTLRAVKAFNISGVVTGAIPRFGLQAWVENEAHEQQDVLPFEFNPQNGRVMIRMVPSGSWILHFRSNDDRGRVVEAEQPVTVADADIRGLQIALQPGIPIPVLVNDAPPQERQQQGGLVVFSGPVSNGAQVHLVSESGLSRDQYYSQAAPNPGAVGAQEGTSGGVETREPPRMEIPNVSPGRYKVLVQPFGAQCVDSVTSGGTDLTRNPLVVTSGGSAPPPITVSMRSDCGSVTVTVHSEQQDASAILLLVADSAPMEPQIQMTQPGASGNGNTFSNLSPGDYRVYAFSSLYDLEYANAEALRDYAGQQVSISPNGNVTVTVNVIERGKK